MWGEKREAAASALREGVQADERVIAALQRAAYLRCAYRETSSRRGALIVGPNPTFANSADRSRSRRLNGGGNGAWPGLHGCGVMR